MQKLSNTLYYNNRVVFRSGDQKSKQTNFLDELNYDKLLIYLDDGPFTNIEMADISAC